MSEELYDVVLHPDSVLKQTAQPVENITDEVKTQIEKMFNTMYRAQGIGLAANQVGILNRIFVMDVEQTSTRHSCGDHGCGHDHFEVEKGKPIALINPEIVWKSDEITPYNEGCLSLPDQHADVLRPEHVRVTYIDVNGEKQEMEVSGLAAKCVQHEIDHLNGILFIDHLSMLKRNTIIRKLTKLKKEEGITDNRLVL
jgi:peptide deformylase